MTVVYSTFSDRRATRQNPNRRRIAESFGGTIAVCLDFDRNRDYSYSAACRPTWS